MNLEKYAGYFHDGSIVNIEQDDTVITITMESSEILKEENLEYLKLSARNTIRGKLLLYNTKEIIINHLPSKTIQKHLDDGEIWNFSIDKNNVFFLVNWEAYPPNEVSNKLETIELKEVESYKWENMPDLKYLF